MCKRSLVQKKMLLLTVLQTSLLLGTVITGLSGASPQESSVARCSLFGNDHIKTFDGSLYNFAGYCSYLLAGDCHKHSFTLLGDYQDGDKIGFSMYLGEYFSLRLSLDGVVMQEEKRVSIPFAFNGIFIEKEAGYYKISSDEHGFVVKTDASGNIQILLQEKHYNKTCGLCGNFNKFLEDDFRTREGTLVGNSYDFANSWALHSENKRCKRVQTPTNTCNISSDMAEKVGAARWHSGFSPPLPERQLACPLTEEQKSQNILIWKGPTKITESNSWPCTGQPQNPTLRLRALSKCSWSSGSLGAVTIPGEVSLGAVTIPGEPVQCPSTLWEKNLF